MDLARAIEKYELNEQALPFAEGFFECMAWTQEELLREDGSTPSLDEVEIDPVSLTEIMEQVTDFYALQHDLLEDYVSHETNSSLDLEDAWRNAGHDFCLNRNGHGAGFWDRGMAKLGDRLSDASKPYGDCSMYSANNVWYFNA